jgi:hypothetical protein
VLVVSTKSAIYGFTRILESPSGAYLLTNVKSLRAKLTLVYRTFNVTLPSHGVAALLMTDDGPEPANEKPPCAQPWLAIGNCANYG